MNKRIFEYDDHFKFTTLDIIFIASINIMCFLCGVFLSYCAIKEINVGYVIVGAIFVVFSLIENIKWLTSYFNIEKRNTHNLLLSKLQYLSKIIYRESSR